MLLGNFANLGARAPGPLRGSAMSPISHEIIKIQKVWQFKFIHVLLCLCYQYCGLCSIFDGT